jgi:Mg2+ and Co2+ transporter CorA
METWVFISASKQAEIKAIEFIDQCGVNRSSSTTPFDLHLILLEVALANWRWYIKSLVERTTEHSSRVIAATVGKAKLSALIDFEINFEDRQGLKVIEEKVLDLLTIFESTSDTITTLLREYEYMQSNTAMKRDRVVSKLQDNLREVDLYAKKVDTLHKRVQGTASLVSSFDRLRWNFRTAG